MPAIPTLLARCPLIPAAGRCPVALALLLGLGAVTARGQPTTAPTGEVHGHAYVHSDSAAAVLAKAWLVLPARATGGAPYQGPLADAPPTVARVPVLVFAHGSSGIAPAIKEWQAWLATSLGVASVTPDSMQLPDRITYKSPVAKPVYEQVHALRAQELQLAMAALPGWAWADPGKVVIAGTSEGAVSVARYEKKSETAAEVGRILYSWSCEDNYHVQQHGTRLPSSLPVLNVMSSTDVYFSPANPWLGNPAALGHCAAALRDNRQSSVVLIPGAPHTLFNLPQAREATSGFLRRVLGL